MLVVETVAKIRREHFGRGKGVKTIARELGLSRNTVRKVLRSGETSFEYERSDQPHPRLGPFIERLEAMLETNAAGARKDRLTLTRIADLLGREGYEGGYDAVRRYAGRWSVQRRGVSSPVEAFVPLSFAPGDAYQFDWSHDQVEIGGQPMTVKVAHLRLCHSRRFYIRAYPRETQEMVFDAHNRAFAFFGGVPQRMVYDNLKAVVETIFTGKERLFNRRFMVMANHYLFEPVACTPASGWEKGQVENQVGNIREWLFTPLARFASFEALNVWLATRSHELAARKHPTSPERSIQNVFTQEQLSLRPIPAPFAGYVEHMVRVSSTCLVVLDRNRYSVPAEYAGQAVSVRSTATDVRIVADGAVIAAHARRFGRDILVCDPWHYLSLLERKPGALRNGMPFRDWDLPIAIQQVRDRILKQPKGDRGFVELLILARDAGLEALQVACELVLEGNVVTAAVVMNEMRRLISPAPPAMLNIPDLLRLQCEPLANCDRYDHLREVSHAVH